MTADAVTGEEDKREEDVGKVAVHGGGMGEMQARRERGKASP